MPPRIVQAKLSVRSPMDGKTTCFAKYSYLATNNYESSLIRRKGYIQENVDAHNTLYTDFQTIRCVFETK